MRPVIPQERIAEIFANPPRTKHGKPFDLENNDIIRRIYFYEQYRQILRTMPSFALVSVNGISTLEYRTLRSQLKGLSDDPVEMLRVRNGVFKKAVLDNIDQSMLQIPGFEARKLNDLLDSMILGPMVLVFPVREKTQQTSPDFLKKLNALIQKPEFNRKPILIGAKLDSLLLSRDHALQVMQMPSLDVLRAQLAGLLEMGAQGLVRVLQQTPQALAMTLEQRTRDLESPKE